MTQALSTPTPISLVDALSVVDAVIGALDRRLPAEVSREDLASAGKLALIEALVGFDGSAEQARAYCFVRVRGAVLDELRRLDPLSRHMRTRVTLVHRATAALERELGRLPTMEELVAVTGLSGAAIAQLDQLSNATQACSLDTTDADGESLHALPDTEAVCPARSAESDDTHTSIQAALCRLPLKHAHILRRYYLDDATLEDLSVELGISKERVRQIREAAEKKLREDFIVLALWHTVLSRR